MAKLLLIFASLAFCNAEMGRQRRWRMERRKKAAAAAAAARREREKNAPRDAESTSDGAIANYDYIGRKDPVTGEITCPWRKGRGKVQSGGSSGVQMAQG